jgi:hypothetical protein
MRMGRKGDGERKNFEMRIADAERISDTWGNEKGEMGERIVKE